MEHDLKCWPELFDNLYAGRKTFEIRKDDRGFQVGDTLLIREWGPVTLTYSGREVRRTISHMLRNFAGIQPGYVILSFAFDGDVLSMIRGQVWTVHGLECDDGEKLGPVEVVLKSDFDDEHKSNDALMRVLADTKLRHEREMALKNNHIDLLETELRSRGDVK